MCSAQGHGVFSSQFHSKPTKTVSKESLVVELPICHRSSVMRRVISNCQAVLANVSITDNLIDC